MAKSAGWKRRLARHRCVRHARSSGATASMQIATGLTAEDVKKAQRENAA